MGAVQLLADALKKVVEDPDLCRSGIEFPRFYVKVRQIEVQDESFRQELRRPLTLRIRREANYWLVDDPRTTVWGTGVSIREALLDYMWKWMDKVRFLEQNKMNLGGGLAQDLEKMRRMVAK